MLKVTVEVQCEDCGIYSGAPIVSYKSQAPKARRAAIALGWRQWRRKSTLVDLCPRCWYEARQKANAIRRKNLMYVDEIKSVKSPAVAP